MRSPLNLWVTLCHSADGIKDCIVCEHNKCHLPLRGTESWWPGRSQAVHRLLAVFAANNSCAAAVDSRFPPPTCDSMNEHPRPLSEALSPVLNSSVYLFAHVMGNGHKTQKLYTWHTIRAKHTRLQPSLVLDRLRERRALHMAMHVPFYQRRGGRAPEFNYSNLLIANPATYQYPEPSFFRRWRSSCAEKGP